MADMLFDLIQLAIVLKITIVVVKFLFKAQKSKNWQKTKKALSNWYERKIDKTLAVQKKKAAQPSKVVSLLNYKSNAK